MYESFASHVSYLHEKSSLKHRKSYSLFKICSDIYAISIFLQKFIGIQLKWHIRMQKLFQTLNLFCCHLRKFYFFAIFALIFCRKLTCIKIGTHFKPLLMTHSFDLQSFQQKTKIQLSKFNAFLMTSVSPFDANIDCIVLLNRKTGRYLCRMTQTYQDYVFFEWILKACSRIDFERSFEIFYEQFSYDFSSFILSWDF